MKIVSYLKKGCGQVNMYNGEDELLATCTEQADGKYLICIWGGPAHGKTAIAQDWDDLNEKSVEIAKLRVA